MNWYSVSPTGGATVSVPLTLTQAESPTDTTVADLSGTVLQAAIAKDIAAGAVGSIYAVAAGQTAFTLPSVPVNPASTIFNVNGVDYYSPGDFTISGAAVTWLNGFTLSATDVVRIKYV
jgi:hypothetical protein